MLTTYGLKAIPARMSLSLSWTQEQTHLITTLKTIFGKDMSTLMTTALLTHTSMAGTSQKRTEATAMSPMTTVMAHTVLVSSVAMALLATLLV